MFSKRYIILINTYKLIQSNNAALKYCMPFFSHFNINLLLSITGFLLYFY